MKFLIIGGDMRQIEMAKLLKKRGHAVAVKGIEKVNDELKNFEQSHSISETMKKCQGVILPLPLTVDGIRVTAPLSNDDIYLAEVFGEMPKNVLVFGGNINDNLIKALTLRDIKIHDYMKSEKVKVQNAVLTAEGAVEIAINRTKKSIFGCKTLVCGYGRIGKFTARYLQALGAKVTATSRKEQTLNEAYCNGFEVLNTNDIDNNVKDYELIINTVPALILNQNVLEKCLQDTVIIDLASKPGGVDFEAANRYRIDTVHALSLPGKTAPVTAAKIITDEILSKLELKE